MSAPSCELYTGAVFGLQVDDPFIIFPSIGAALVGVFCGLRLWKGKSPSLAVPFFLFATMMSEVSNQFPARVFAVDFSFPFARPGSPTRAIVISMTLASKSFGPLTLV